MCQSVVREGINAPLPPLRGKVSRAREACTARRKGGLGAIKQHAPNFLSYVAGPSKHRVIRESDHSEALLLKPFRTRIIAPQIVFFKMLPAVNFDDQSSFRAE